MKWTTMIPVLNEVDIIESKLLHNLKLGNVVVVEGSIPQTHNKGPKGLSSDGTTEILKSYADKITYLQAGQVHDRATLQNIGLEHIRKTLNDTEILHLCGTDEFCHPSVYEKVEQRFANSQDWLVYVNLVNLIDGTRWCKNRVPNYGGIFPFAPGKTLKAGMYHERFYRYRPDLSFFGTAHALSVVEASTNPQVFIPKPLFSHPDFYFHRSVLPDHNIILHYKYIDGLKKLLRDEMSYLAEDEKMQPFSEEIFHAALERVRNIFDGEPHEINISEHPVEVQKSKWFKPERMKWNWNITLDEVMAIDK